MPSLPCRSRLAARPLSGFRSSPGTSSGCGPRAHISPSCSSSAPPARPPRSGREAALCGRIGREVVELSRPEIGELREEEGHHRGASSTMPQKANPIGSEAVIGMSVLAAHHAGALLAALQGTHERSAGEWQVEWDAVPAVFAAAGGAVAGAARIVEGLRVLPERMRANLELDGGTIMAEAAM